MRLTCCALSLSLRRLAPARHSNTLPGSCFKKNDKTLLLTRRISLSAFSFCMLSLLSRLTFVSPPSFRSFQSHTCGFFSAFAHATCSLSVYSQYLGLGFNAPVFTLHNQPELLFHGNSISLNLRGCHSLWPFFPERSTHDLDDKPFHISTLLQERIQIALCRLSIALLTDIAFAFFSCGY